jgi:DNA-binding response OmpR family regulator
MQSVAPLVLVIDDDEATSELLRFVLEAEGYRVEWAPDGMSGIARITAGGVDFALLDWNLSDMEGSAVLRLLAEHDASVPIVLLTASSRTVREPLPERVRVALAKPFDLDRLLDTVSTYCPHPQHAGRLDDLDRAVARAAQYVAV